MTARTGRARVVVVGAGVVGAALAYESARQGLDVTVLERGARAAQGGTRWSMGGVSWLSAASDPRVRDLSRLGLDRHRALSEELGTDSGFRPRSMVILAHEQSVLDGLAGLLAAARDHGFDGRIVSSDELRAIEPGLARNLGAEVAIGAAVCEQGRVDAVRLTEAWLGAAEALGATIRYGVDVREIASAGADGVTAIADDGRVHADRVVVAGGAWTRRLLRASALDTALLHTHAEILETDPLPPTVANVVGAASQARVKLECDLAAPGLAARWGAESPAEILPPIVELGVTQFDDGRVRIGQISRGVSGFLSAPLPSGEAALREMVRPYFPALATAPARHHGCPVSISKDRLPIAGPLPDADGVWVVAGLASPLIYLPTLAQRVAASLGGDAAPELAPFSPARFVGGGARG